MRRQSVYAVLIIYMYTRQIEEEIIIKTLKGHTHWFCTGEQLCVHWTLILYRRANTCSLTLILHRRATTGSLTLFLHRATMGSLTSILHRATMGSLTLILHRPTMGSLTQLCHHLIKSYIYYYICTSDGHKRYRFYMTVS